MSLVGKTAEEQIWNYLFSTIKNEYGTAGVMGNLYAESGLKPTNLQDTYEKKLGFTDLTYTEKVDTGEYSNFIRDSAGYGLAQWTFWSRKQALLLYVKNKQKSIGDLESQLEFLITEFKNDYPTVWKVLTTAQSIMEASNSFLFNYEVPANQSAAVQKERASYGQTYYDRYVNHKQTEVIQEAESLINAINKSAFSKYMISTGTHYISNSGSDENGSYRYGAAGDQTGKEWTLRSWYNRPWDCVLRYPDINVGIKMAELGCKAALNNKIGYDQYERYTYWQQLQKVGYDPSKITVACESDCSAGVIANTRAAGYLLNISKLKDLSATYTGDMKNAYIKAGFQVLTGNNYLNSPQYLLPGDILLNEAHHTAMNITLGTSARSGSTSSYTDASNTTVTALRLGDSGSAVKEMQQMLIACGYDCGSWGADGDFGQATLEALKNFQRDAFIAVDGVYGPEAKVKLEETYKAKQNASSNNSSSYIVQVIADSLNVRTGPSTSYDIIGEITDQGYYTIVKTNGTWGQLKTGNGWISLNYTKKASGNVQTSDNKPIGKTEEATTPAQSNTNTSFKKYNLSNDKIKKIANLAVQENGEGAVAYEVSLMANLFELQTKYKDIYKYIREGGWFSKAATHMDNGSSSNKAVAATKDVLINGNRVFPAYINEHDCFSDITSVTNNGKSITKTDRSKYIRDVTIIKNKYGSTYTFYMFPTSQSDPFGYTKEAYEKITGKKVESQESTVSNKWKATGTATSTVDELNYRKTPNGEILGQLNKGDRFEVDGKKSDKWIHANVQGTICYIYSAYVKYDK